MTCFLGRRPDDYFGLNRNRTPTMNATAELFDFELSC